MSDTDLHAKKIFFEALEQSSPDAISKHVEKACGDDDKLRERVDQLLRAHQDAGNFLGGSSGTDPTVDAPVEWGIDPTVDPPVAEQPGTQIGSYKLLQVIGEGGMGVVYMAQQTEPVSRRVALKIIKPGMDSKQVVARFEAERQALAMMEHPNIARVLDAGTTDSGRPYFVMELVKGIPITEHCDQQRLRTNERLDLMVPICQAVQHAHQKGIIHRDLKPTNILIAQYDDKPVPKIIDFGVAKAVSQQLTEKTLFTQYGQIVGTIEYMSPEQASLNQLDVDTRTDIYSLGVLLYELLAGERPFDGERLRKAAFDELLRIIREEEPPRPSMRLSSSSARPTIAANRQTEAKKLSLLMRGELDWIVMKALEKDRTRRYETANGLGMDLQRYLQDEPVVACPPSASYRMKKFIRRNKSIVATTTAIAIALVLGMVGTTLQTFRANSERDRAVAAEEDLTDKILEVQSAKEDTEEALGRESQAKDDLAEKVEAEQIAKNEALWNLYVARLFPMNEAWKNRDFGRLEYLLEQSAPVADQPDFRGWEWYYFADQVRKASRTLDGSDTPNGKLARCKKTGRIAIANRNRTIDIWDAAGKELLKTLPEHGGWIHDLAWSWDGTKLACVNGKHVAVWNVQSNKLMYELQTGPKNGAGIAWSRDDEQLASTEQSGIISIWDVETGKLQKTMTANIGGHIQAALCLSWHPDGKLLAAGHRHGVCRVWSVDESRIVWEKYASEDGSGLSTVAWSPDGEMLAAGHAPNSVVWNRNGQTVVTLIGHESEVHSMDWSHDGARLATAGRDHTIRVWNASTGESERTIRIHGAPVLDVAFDPTGRNLVSGTSENVRVIELTDLPQATKWKLASERLSAVAWSPRGDLLCINSDDSLGCTVVTNRDGQVIRSFNGRPRRDFNAKVSWNRDGTHLCTKTYFGRCVIWDVKTGRATRTIERPNGVDQGGGYVRWSPDGGRIATVFRGSAHLCETSPPTPITRLDPSDDHVWCVAWSHDGSFLALGKANGLSVWGIHDRARRFHSSCEGKVRHAVAWSPDGRLVAAGNDSGTIFWFNACDGQLVQKVSAHKGKVVDIQWNPSGRRIASADESGVLKIWDAATATNLVTLRANDTRINSMQWSPDGRRLTCACQDGSVRLWGSVDMELPGKSAVQLESGIFASVKSREEEFAEQEQALTNAVQAAPEDPVAWRKRGEFYRLWQRWEQAAADLDECLNCGLDNQWVRMQAAQSHLMTGNREAYLRHCRAVNPGDNSVPRVASLVPGATGKLDEILQVAQQRAKEHPDKRHLVYQPGVVLYRLGRYSEALEILLKSMEFNSNEMQRATMKLWLAMTYHQLGDERLAASHLDQAMSVALPHPNQVLRDWEVTVLVELHTIRIEAKKLIKGDEKESVSKIKPKDASELFNDELMHPDGLVHQIGLAEVHVIGGHYSEARTCLNTALEQLNHLAETYPDQASRIRAYQSKALSMLGKIDLLTQE